MAASVLAFARQWEAFVIVPSAVAGLALVAHGHGSGDDLHGAVDGAALMAAAMMPLAARSAALVAERALRYRRTLAVVEYAAGFAAVWFLMSLVTMRVVAVAAGAVSPAMVFLVAAAVATGWQLSPARRRLVDRCGRLRTGAPTGWRADMGALRCGVDRGVRCLFTCWASMLAMAAAPGLLLMAVILAANLSEWAPGPNPFARHRRARPALAYAALGLVALPAF